MRAEMEKEKQGELEELETRLKTQYDAKLAKLQEAMMSGKTDDHVAFEAEFARITEDYETGRDKAIQQVS